ncbi:Acetyltransferase (GNAT) family protein [Asanoa hainanensis]|uniref:Acetyltransferase (GNAT) family protein n=1 Tax=Asanoa hainanensis TaxID=560556 RepID=A0A239NRN5_9ACTN|nr:N-acetyltransferase [Asanoa hainanensis]SNT57581.1 Acetyltransferase (GNAT) family protein [Asanoa hainanensis]
MSFRFSGVETLGPTHAVGGFDCGSAAQSEWLAEHALQSHRAGLSRVYVVRGIEAGLDRVVGYYALAAGSVAPASASKRMMHGTGRYHQPVVLLTRLGVDRSAQGVGLGRALVVDALRRIAGAAEVIGVRAVLIHCESPSARDFYLRLAEFEPSPTDPMHLLLLMKDLRRALNPAAALSTVGTPTG